MFDERRGDHEDGFLVFAVSELSFPQLVRNQRRLRELKERTLIAVSQVEFDALRYSLEHANHALPPSHRDSATQMQSHVLSLVRRLGDPIFENYLENPMRNDSSETAN